MKQAMILYPAPGQPTRSRPRCGISRLPGTTAAQLAGVVALFSSREVPLK